MMRVARVNGQFYRNDVPRDRVEANIGKITRMKLLMLDLKD
jgi:hypothetical protein